MKKLEVSIDDLKHNLNLIKQNSNGAKIIAVVKANGMGLDLIKYSNFLINNGIDILAVANTDEAINLKNAGIESEIIMLSEVCSEEELEVLIKNNITLTIGSLEEKEKIEKLVLKIEKNENQKYKVKAHIKIDTGFGRYGFLYTDEAEILEASKSTDNIEITGVYTHFSKPIDKKWTKIQFERFNNFIPKIKEINKNIIFHCSSSTASLLYPEMTLDAIRVGSVIQGRVLKNTLGLKKVGIFKTEINAIKEVPKGYNISYSNEFKTRKKTKIAIIPVRIY